jgi:SNF2 family DNA or RNA helicase
MTDDQKAKYYHLEAEDRDRFERESEEADKQRLAEQEARRKAQVVQDGEEAACRGARQRLDQEREEKERIREQRRLAREADMDEDERAERDRKLEIKRRETEARQRKRAAEEQALAKQHKKLDKEEAKKTVNRLEYLFKQSPIFAKLKMGVGSMDDETTEEEKDAAKKSSKQQGRGARNKNNKPAAVGSPSKPHHIHDKDSAEEDDDDEEDDQEQHVFLTKQPSVIKFGQLKPYQLESLNWMIHLAEKGLNGILADEVRRIWQGRDMFVGACGFGHNGTHCYFCLPSYSPLFLLVRWDLERPCSRYLS